jgi:hypothetical protein
MKVKKKINLIRFIEAMNKLYKQEKVTKGVKNVTK